jgi:preprotein translocase subunit SecD
VTTRKTVEEVINIATIRDRFSKRFQISGLDGTEEARNLSLLLRSGALAAPVDIVEERTVGPSLGKENIEQGKRSFIIGFLLIAAVMIGYYKVFGVIAVLTLIFNVALILAILSALQATLTLPGIAGITLTIGMAVDANVLIYERIKEEWRNGTSIQSSIYAGFERAFATIFDSNITTLLAAVMLFGIGSGPVKGFAVTLTIGILTSMFTAVMCTRMMVNFVYGQRRVNKLWI